MSYIIYLTYIMKGDDFQKRKTKKDKAKRNFELYGKFTPKHIRQQEELQRIHAERVDNSINSTSTNTNNHTENISSKKKKKDKK